MSATDHAEVKIGLLKNIVKVEDTYSLQEFNPLKAGGVADYFTVARDTVELAAAVKSAIDLGVPYVVVGSGESVLFSDGGFPGLVIHNQTSSFGVAMDKSHMVVDSGLSLDRFIILASSKGLGGLTHLYGEGGTVGGALYANVSGSGWPILSSVRYVTMLVPPARLDKEATIIRYKRDWLEKSSDQTRLQHLRATKNADEPLPVILTVLFQLTSVRSDELQNRMSSQLLRPEYQRPGGVAFGPVFTLTKDIPVNDLLKGAGVHKLRSGTVYPDRHHPNFFRSKTPTARSSDIRELTELVRQKVESVYAVSLVSRHEYLGVW